MPEDPQNLFTVAGGAPGESFPPPPPFPLPRDIWKFRDLLLFVAFIPFALMVSGLGVFVAYTALRPFSGWPVKMGELQSNTIFLLIQQSFFYLFILGFLFLLAKLGHRQSFWRSLGWRKPTIREVGGYLAGGVGLALAATLALSLRPDVQEFPLEKLLFGRRLAWRSDFAGSFLFAAALGATDFFAGAFFAEAFLLAAF